MWGASDGIPRGELLSTFGGILKDGLCPVAHECLLLGLGLVVGCILRWSFWWGGVFQLALLWSCELVCLGQPELLVVGLE
jgi:hypothetical protein